MNTIIVAFAIFGAIIAFFNGLRDISWGENAIWKSVFGLIVYTGCGAIVGVGLFFVLKYTFLGLIALHPFITAAYTEFFK